MVPRYEMYEHPMRMYNSVTMEKADGGEYVKYSNYLELSQLASKLFKMSTYHLLSPEERKRFNELTEGCNDDP